MRSFLPAYKATRIIFEVLIESLPQSLLQAFIYIVVIRNVKAGTASQQQLDATEEELDRLRRIGITQGKSFTTRVSTPNAV